MKTSNIHRDGKLNAKLRYEQRTSTKSIKNDANIDLVRDPQEIELESMENSGEQVQLDLLLIQLDAVLDRISEEDYDLKKYLIEAVLEDEDPEFDIEADGIIHRGQEIFGDCNQIMAAYSC